MTYGKLTKENKMGISPFKVSSSAYPSEDHKAPVVKLPNPDPKNYEVIEAKQEGIYLLVKIRYPDCTNYEGMKILLYEDTTLPKLLRQKYIDPHFSQNDKFKSPIARFEPTDKGWDLGIMLMTQLMR